MKTRLLYRIFAVGLAGLLFIAPAPRLAEAQQPTAAEYQVKAVFLYHFTRFIEWPAASYHSASDPFVIGIIGDDPFGSYLDEIVAGEKVGTHPIVVKRIGDMDACDHCHILYIGSRDQDFVRRILQQVAGKSILTVSDMPGYFRWEGMIRFFTENNKIRVQVHVEQSRTSGLVISSKLLSLAKTD